MTLAGFFVERVRGEDAEEARAAFDLLYETHFVPLWRLARQLTRSDATAKDVAQDVFVSLWTNRQKWHVDGSVRAYLYRAVRNRALNAIRDGGRRKLAGDGTRRGDGHTGDVAHPYRRDSRSPDGIEVLVFSQ